MVTRPIELADGATRQPVPATLLVGVDALSMVRAERLWAPRRLDVIERYLLGGKVGSLPQHVHWSWALKALDQGVQHANCAVELAGRIEGLMTLIVTGKTARLPGAVGLPLVYVDYLESAPWNNSDFTPTPVFRGVGLRLIQAAVQHSLDRGWHGRIGLHSLPQSEPFYVRTCGVVSLGSDPVSGGLTSFELDQSNVAAMMAK